MDIVFKTLNLQTKHYEIIYLWFATQLLSDPVQPTASCQQKFLCKFSITLCPLYKTICSQILQTNIKRIN